MVPSHLISARLDPHNLHTCRYRYLLTSSVQSLDLQIPKYLKVPMPAYSPRQCSAWIRRYPHICRYRYLLTSSVRLDPQIPTYL